METTYCIKSDSGPLSNLIISEALFERAITSKRTDVISVSKDELEWIITNNPGRNISRKPVDLVLKPHNVMVKINPFRKVLLKAAHVDQSFAQTMVNCALPFFFISSVDIQLNNSLEMNYPILNVLRHTKCIFTADEIIQKVKELAAESPEFKEGIYEYDVYHEDEDVLPIMEVIESFIRDGYDESDKEGVDILNEDDIFPNIVYLACIILFDPSYKHRISMSDIPDYAYSARTVNYRHLTLTDMIFTASGTKFFNANGSSSTITDEDYLLLLC